MLTLLLIIVAVFVIAACIALIYGKKEAQEFLSGIGATCGGCLSTIFWMLIAAIAFWIILDKIHGG